MKSPENKQVVNEIPQNSLIVVESKKSIVSVRVNQFTNGLLKFTVFALIQFTEGVMLIPELKEGNIYISRDIFKLYVLLNNALRDSVLASTLSDKENSDILLEISRKELVMLKYWLETRMTHCEKEREAGNPKFNVETYIGQKLLLIDIRELLIGEVIDID